MADNIIVNFILGGNASGANQAFNQVAQGAGKAAAAYNTFQSQHNAFIGSMAAQGRALGVVSTQANQATTAFTGFSNNFLLQRLKFIGATVLITGIATAFVELTKNIIETSAEFQRLTTSFVSILGTKLVDQNIELTPELLKALRAESAGIFKDATIAAIQTAATTKEYVTILQTSLAVGQQIGLTQREIEIITKRLVQAANAFGIEQEKVGTSIGQIFTGNVRVTNQLGRNLGIASGEGKALLKASIENGTVFEFLEKRTRAFAATGKEAADNFIQLVASLKDVFQLGSTAAFAPLFQFINKTLISLREAFLLPTGQFSSGLEDFIASANQLVKSVLPGLKVLINEISVAFSRLSGSIDGTGSALSNFLFILGTAAKYSTPFLQLLSKIHALGLFITGIGSLTGFAEDSATRIDKVSDAIERFRATQERLNDVNEKDLSSLRARQEALSELLKTLEATDRVATDSQVKQLSGFAESFPEIKDINLRSLEDRDKLATAIKNELIITQRYIDLQEIEKLSTTDLITKVGFLSAQREHGADVAALLAKAQDELLKRYTEEANKLGISTDAHLKHLIKTNEDALAQLKLAGNIDEVTRAINDNAIAIQRSSDHAVGPLSRLNKEEIGKIVGGQEQNLKDQIAQIQILLGQLGGDIKPKPSKSVKPLGDRDELKDFLAEVRRQFDVIKQFANGLQKEASRIIDTNRKTVQDLAEAGVITFADAIARQRELIDEEFGIQKQFADQQLDFIKNARKIGETIAKDTEERAKASHAVVTDAKGKQIRVGGTGFDTRARKEELLKLASEEIAILNSLGEDTRKAEELRSALVAKEVQNRIDLRKQERISLDQAATDTRETLAVAEEALQSFGVISKEALVRSGIGRTQSESEQQRKALAFQLFPLGDKKFRKILEDALTETAGLGRELGREAAGLLQGLQAAGEDPVLLEELRFDLQESIKNEGLIDLLLKARLAKLGDIKEAVLKLDNLKAASKVVDAQLESGAKPTEAALKLQDESRKAVLAAETALTAINQDYDTINKALISLEKVATTEVDREKIRAALRSLAAKVRQDEIKGEKELVLTKQEQLQLQTKLVDFELQKLDILDQLNQKQRDLGIIQKSQAAQNALDLIRQRERLLEDRRGTLQAQLSFLPSNPEEGPIADQKRALQLELANLGVQMFDLKNKAFDLSSPLLAVRDAFKSIGDAVGSLPEPFNKLKGVFSGLEHLADVVIGKSRPKPEDKILDASAVYQRSSLTFAGAVDQFTASIVNKFGSNGNLPPVTPDRSGLPRYIGDLPITPDRSGLPHFDPNDPRIQNATNDAQKKVHSAAGAWIRVVGQAVAGVLAGIANKDLGQGISGLGAALQSVPDPSGITQAIGAAVEIVGGVVSFFGAAAKKKTQELAKTIDIGIADIKHSLSVGAIGLGEAIRKLQAAEADAARQLSGQKGGYAALKKIEDSTNAEIQSLRDQAAKEQADFKANLDLLRSPKSLRDTITAINAIADSAKKFIASFENPADALAAVKDAQEFVRISIQELKDDIQKTLKDLQQNLKDATDKFATDERAILLEGRINPAVSVAESKRQRLVALERDFQKQKLDLENQISAEQKKLDYANSRNLIEEKIARLAQQGADALGNAADKLNTAANSLQKAFETIGNFNFNNAQNAPQTITLNLKLNGQPIGSTQVGIGVEQHLEMSGLLSPSNLSRFHATVN
jgi:hypothetical protein